MKNDFRLPDISVSLLNCDLSNLAKEIKILEKNNVKILHLDVMDGNFVPNLTFGAPVIESIKRNSKSLLDIHLMISNPIQSYLQYLNLNPFILTFHYECCKISEIKFLIEKIKKNSVLSGISIKPNTDVEKIKPLLNTIDIVLVMTVEPGFGGQKIVESCLKKIKWLSDYKKQNNLNYVISADGGINEHNIKYVVSLGCQLPVVGSAIFSSKNVAKKIMLLKTLTTK